MTNPTDPTAQAIEELFRVATVLTNSKYITDLTVDINTILALRQKVEGLQQEVGFWMGEFQDNRPEIVEYRELARRENLASAETARMSTIAKQIRIENEECPQLRQRLHTLEQENAELKETS